MKILRQIFESFRFALQSVIVGKVRTLLSLLGITIGIFAIISVFTIVDTMESYMRGNVNALGTNILYVGKWPWVGGGAEWWTYAARPETATRELSELTEQLPSAEAVAIATYFSRSVKYGNRTKDHVSLFATTKDYERIRRLNIASGRMFNQGEDRAGSLVCLVGATVAADIFDTEDPRGKILDVAGHKMTVIGVFEREGDNMLGQSFDDQLLIPYRTARNFINLNYAGKDLIIKASDGVDMDDFKAETQAVMRRIRRISPDQEPNFSINEVSGLMQQLDSIFSMINLVGGIIGFFSILVGGFGVANIMFVSVRERTSQIGIQKALGAKRYSILLQFTFEAVMLSVVGGLLGLAFIWIASTIVSLTTDYTITLTLANIMRGVLISSLIGAVSGIFPAWSAARLNPVSAISKS